MAAIDPLAVDTAERPTGDGGTPYDEVFYPGHAFASTHPDRLGTIASLFGMRPAPVDACRVLELGCGDGANLIPLAYQWPKSEFVGIDLSATAIAAGVAFISATGLGNVALSQFDIMGVGDDFGEFDYIVAHGVYSWVPAPVRRKMLAIFRDRLKPQGVVYVSFNAYPGSHLRNLVRDMIRHHVRAVKDPREKIERSRSLLAFLARTSARDDRYGAILRALHEQSRLLSDAALYHDDLNPHATAFLLHDVAAEAGAHGLQYLAEADLNLSAEGNLAPRTREFLDRIPADRPVEREQCYDFLTGRWFHNSLFCRSGIELRRELEAQCARSYYVTANPIAAVGNRNLAASTPAVLEPAKSEVLASAGALADAAHRVLIEAFPQAVSFSDLFSGALALGPGSAAGSAEASSPEKAGTLAEALLRAYGAGEIDLCLHPPRPATGPGARPQASLVARKQAEAGPLVTNLRHIGVDLSDAYLRRVLILADGTRTLDELAAEAGDPGNADAPAAKAAESSPRERVEAALRRLARLALLVA